MFPPSRATKREAEASAFVVLKPAVLKALPEKPQRRSAGGGASGRDHGGEENSRSHSPCAIPLPLSHVDVTMRLCENGVAITSKVTTTAVTGVEMEALVAVQRGRAHCVRYVQSSGQGHRHPRDRAGTQVRR